jgi:hypothetical protein
LSIAPPLAQNTTMQICARLRLAAAEALRHGRVLARREERGDFLRALPRGSVGAELGVFRGAFTRAILDVVQPRELHLVDVWHAAFGARYPNWGWYTRYGRLTTARALADVRRVVARHDRRAAAEIHVDDDIAALAAFPDGHFDWIYLDSAHDYEHTRALLAAAAPKVRADGRLLGHDWRPDPAYLHHGVYRAVREFLDAGGWRLEALDDFTQWRLARA